MSFGVDVNILVYASDAGSPLHEKAVGFLTQCARQRQVFCLAWVTLMSYLRISTHPSVFTRPLHPEEAMRNIEALLRLPHCRVITEDDGFWSTYRELTSAVPTRGNLVPDAHLAAILLRNGVTTLYTHDRDFRKFPLLDVRDPLDQGR
jgi:toxin-antitoxin system PIN domain toxin